ncbi:MAG: enolase C-terminal domain-like protein [Candidatus Saccharibacteria bacterium]
MEKQPTTIETLRPYEQYLEHELNFEGFEAIRVDIPFKYPMLLPFGEVTQRPSGWVIVSSEQNCELLFGFGEGATLDEALFTDDSGHNIAQNASSILEVIGAEQDCTFSGALEIIDRFIFDDGGIYPTARLAVEMSILDLLAKSKGLSIGSMIGLPEEINEVAFGKSIGAENAYSIFSQAEAAINSGSNKIKLKVSPSSFDQVIDAITNIKKQYPNCDIMVDANGTFDLGIDSHINMLSTLDLMELVLIEEPVSRVGAVRGLESVYIFREKLPQFNTKVCLDDCLKTLDDCMEAIDRGLAQVINIKPGRIGSFVKSLDLIDWVNSRGGQVMVGGMFEATPGRCMTSILGAYCAYKGSSVVGDLSLAQERLNGDLVNTENQLQINSSGNISLPKGIGWGF